MLPMIVVVLPSYWAAAAAARGARLGLRQLRSRPPPPGLKCDDSGSPEEKEKWPKLSRFIVKNVDIHTRSYAMKNSMFEVLTMHDETMLYLEIPGWLSEASEIGYQYGGFSEHLMMSITDSPQDLILQIGYFNCAFSQCNTTITN